MALPELFYLRTVPHTGTHFLLHIFMYYLDKRDIQLEGVHQGVSNSDIKTHHYMRRVLENRISFDEMLRQLLAVYKCQQTIKYFGLFEHLSLPGFMGYQTNDTWINDFDENGIPGYPVKTVMPIRHPMKAVLTVLLQTIGSDQKQYREEELAWIRGGFEFLAEKAWLPNYYILPIDNLEKDSFENRYLYLTTLLTKFISVRFIEKEIYNLADKWKRVHTVNIRLNAIQESLYQKKDRAEFNLLQKLKQEDLYNIQGAHEIIDREASFYYNHQKICELMGIFDYL